MKDEWWKLREEIYIGREDTANKILKLQEELEILFWYLYRASLLFCKITNRYTIISQIIILLLHVSALCVIFRELVVSNLPRYKGMSNVVVGNTIENLTYIFTVEILMFKIIKILKLSYL